MSAPTFTAVPEDADEWLAQSELLDVPLDVLRTVESQLAIGMPSATAVRSLLRIAEFHYNATRSDDAIRTAELARQKAIALGSRTLRRRTASVLGAMHSDHAHYQQAAEALTEALALARQSGQPREVVPVLNNLAMLLRNLGQFHGALTAARKALDLCGERVGLKASPVLAASNVLDVALALRDPSLVHDLLYGKPPPGTDEFPEASIGRSIFFANRARLFILLNDVDRARCELENLNLGRGASGRHRYVSGFAQGVVDCATGRPEVGLALLDELKESTKAIGSMYHDALAACAEGAEVAGRPDRALRYLRELAELQRARAMLVAELPLEVRLVTGDEKWQGPHVLANAITQLEGLAEIQLSSLVSASIDSAVACGHDLHRCFRVGKLARIFAAHLGMTESEAMLFETAGRVYDVGMMAIPGRILSKCRGLSSGEVAIVEEHTRYGAEIIKRVQFEFLELASVVAHSHHEQWNGEGYPDRLSGESIPMAARIVALCDCFDSMTQARPHRPTPLSVPAALREISAESGSKFDPSLAARFVTMIKAEFWRHDEFKEFLAADAHENQYVRTRQRLDRLVASPSLSSASS